MLGNLLVCVAHHGDEEEVHEKDVARDGKSKLAAIEAQIAEAQSAKAEAERDARLAAREAELGHGQKEHLERERVLHGAVRCALENGRRQGVRPHFSAPFAETRATPFAHPVSRAAGIAQPGDPAQRNRARQERVGMSPILGGGHTLRLEEARLARHEAARLQEEHQRVLQLYGQA